MARTRALLTERDRELIRGETDNESRRYQAISEVRSRVQDNLSEDVELLEEHHPKLLSEIREVVCDEH